MAVNVSVKARRNEHSDRLIRRFIKKCKKEKVVEKYRERTDFYQKPSVKRRNKKRRAERMREIERLKREKYTQRAKYRK
tara:strand:- start:12199 stop:12435 length:237 start_codon:yes stop_codon:yes gene_type:complete